MAWRRFTHPALITVCVLPAALLVSQAIRGGLGANPVEEITHQTGQWALRFLMLSLCITPVRRLTRWRGVAPFRRTLGLAAFGYASAHFATYLALDLEFRFSLLGEDILERPYITLGFSALALMVPLALTSTQKAVRRLGQRWLRLHRLVYLVALLAVLHFLWLVKADLREPLIYAFAIALLLGVRLWWHSSKRRLASST